ncbi:LysM peptidoglycan-binding domain-containing protein [Paenibacillus sp. 1P07SE]|uniref:LysM peptidoglycan-binding domain-containing protein n=1 Tax=Paenibacillus sp. 1P07SE TaxID=3132209 RepID=UPI0039A7135C
MKIHIVKQGDSLFQLAGKYGVTVEELLKLNPDIANPDEIQVGMKIKIPSSASKPPEMAIAHQHTVKQGDTLWKLSKAWGVPLGDLIKANPQLKNPNVLLTGETVHIPKAAEAKETDLHLPEMPMMPELPAMPIMESPPGKTSTAPIAMFPGKTSTAPVTPMPEPMPHPQPVSEPPKMVHHHHAYPIHLEYHKSTTLFQQSKQPAVEAGAHDIPKTYEPAPMPSYGAQMPVAGAASQWPGISELQAAPGGYGYSYAAPQASPGQAGGYGGYAAQAAPAQAGGYGGHGAQPAGFGGYELPLETTSTGGEMTAGYGGYPMQPAWDGAGQPLPGSPGMMQGPWHQPGGPWSGGMHPGYGPGPGPGQMAFPGMMGGPAELMGYQQQPPQPLTSYYTPQAYGQPGGVMGIADQGYGGSATAFGAHPPAKPCDCGCQDKRVDETDTGAEVKTSTAAVKRSAAAGKSGRAKTSSGRSAAKRTARRRSQNQPWINN